jgi:hypothetical protein
MQVVRTYTHAVHWMGPLSVCKPADSVCKGSSESLGTLRSYRARGAGRGDVHYNQAQIRHAVHRVVPLSVCRPADGARIIGSESLDKLRSSMARVAGSGDVHASHASRRPSGGATVCQSAGRRMVHAWTILVRESLTRGTGVGLGLTASQANVHHAACTSIHGDPACHYVTMPL